MLLAIIAGILAIQLIYNITNGSSDINSLGDLAGVIFVVIGLTGICTLVGIVLAGGMNHLLEIFDIYL